MSYVLLFAYARICTRKTHGDITIRDGVTG